MRKLEKLISKAKEKGIGNTTIFEMEINGFKTNEKMNYTVLCTLMSNKTKKYIRNTFPAKDEAISNAKHLMQNYPKSDCAVFMDWSIITESEWDELLNANKDEELNVFCQMKQKAVEAWQEESP